MAQSTGYGLGLILRLHQLFRDYPNLAEFTAAAGIASSSIIEELSRGLSNYNFKIANKWVLRINRQTASLGSGRQTEVMAWTAAANMSVAPELYRVSDCLNFYLSQFIPSASSTLAMTQPNANTHNWAQHSGEQLRLTIANPSAAISVQTQRLLDLMQTLSQLPKPDIHITAMSQWRQYQQSLQQAALCGDQAMVQRVNSLMARSADIDFWCQTVDDAQQHSQQFCHRDLNPDNILSTSARLLAIDYEYACASGPYTELATVLACHHLEAEQQACLAQQYLNAQGLGHWQVDALVSAVHCYWVFSCCWALLRVQGTQLSPYLEWFDDYYQLLPAPRQSGIQN